MTSSLVNVLELLEQANSVAGLILNVLVLFVIIQFSGTLFGTYKNLLLTFTLANTFLVALVMLTHPRTLSVGTTHGIVTDTVLDDRRITAFYIGFQSVPFTLLVIHFLYRYCSVRRPHLVALFSRKPYILLMAQVVLGGAVAWYLLSMYTTTDPKESNAKRVLLEACEEKYSKRIENALIVLDHWHDNKLDITLLVTISIANSMVFISCLLALSLALLTFHNIESTESMSIQSKKLQRKLLVALCAQAAVPMLFVHVPSLISMDFPLLRIVDTGVHDWCSPMHSFFPVCDAAVLILLMPDYRRGLLGCVRSKRTQVEMITLS